jgi:hypothetical protein
MASELQRPVLYRERILTSVITVKHCVSPTRHFQSDHLLADLI